MDEGIELNYYTQRKNICVTTHVNALMSCLLTTFLYYNSFSGYHSLSYQVVSSSAVRTQK